MEPHTVVRMPELGPLPASYETLDTGMAGLGLADEQQVQMVQAPDFSQATQGPDYGQREQATQGPDYGQVRNHATVTTE